MENNIKTTTVPTESLARDLARGFRFTGCSFAVLTATGAVSFALGLIGMLYFDNLFLLALSAVYATFGVLFLLKAPEIEKSYHEEFRA